MSLYESGIEKHQMLQTIDINRFIDHLNGINVDNTDNDLVANRFESKQFSLTLRQTLISFVVILFGSIISLIAVIIENIFVEYFLNYKF